MFGSGRHTVRRASGWTQITDPLLGTVEHDVLKCVHCQYIWQVQPGSGRKRGFCLKCMGPTCGQEKCVPCSPVEKQLDDAEKLARGGFGDVSFGMSPGGFIVPM